MYVQNESINSYGKAGGEVLLTVLGLKKLQSRCQILSRPPSSLFILAAREVTRSFCQVFLTTENPSGSPFPPLLLKIAVESCSPWEQHPREQCVVQAERNARPSSLLTWTSGLVAPEMFRISVAGQATLTLGLGGDGRTSNQHLEYVMQPGRFEGWVI